MKQQTQIAKTKAKYASNRAYIQKVVGLTESEYDELVFETGCEFLESLYPYGSEMEPYYMLVVKDPNYWNWWRTEWKKFEETLLSTNEVVDVVNYYNCIAIMNTTSFINHSYYHNYSKRANHVL